MGGGGTRLGWGRKSRRKLTVLVKKLRVSLSVSCVRTRTQERNMLHALVLLLMYEVSLNDYAMLLFQVTADVKMQLEALGEELESQKELTIVSKRFKSRDIL